MLDFETVLNMMRKYGYTSTTLHPYIYKKENTLGICYSYVDEQYGILERVKFFDNVEILEEFLKRLTWVKNNGKAYNVRMILDNYESVDPKIIFLRNEKIMVKGEMFDIAGFEARALQQQKMDAISRVILQAGNLLLVYDDLKNRQLEYYSSITKLKNDLRQKYFELQQLVDAYNGISMHREVVLVPDIKDARGINLLMETSAKDRYNQYKVQHPSMEEAQAFVKDVWELNANLEANVNYYHAQAEENRIRNEERVVNAKLEFMKSLDIKKKSIFKVNLVQNFRRINEECKKNSVEISNNFIQEKVASIMKKYSYYDTLDFFSISDYLKESIQNTNYADLALKYSKKTTNEPEKPIVKLPLNEIVSHLSKEYATKLSIDEQAVLILYNSRYRKFMNLILDIPDFATKPIPEIISILNQSKEFSKIKTECYDMIRQRINLPVNTEVKNKIFHNIRFDSYENFVASIVFELHKLKDINTKMLLNSDLNMYFYVPNIEGIGKKFFILVSHDLNSLFSLVKNKGDMIALALIKQDTPVLYSPYTLDFGDLYSKENMEITLKTKNNFELLIDVGDVVVNKDDNLTKVVKYFSVPKMVENLSVVDDIQMAGSTMFCKLAISSRLNKVPVIANPQVSMAKQVAQVAPVTTQAQVAQNPQMVVQSVMQRNQELQNAGVVQGVRPVVVQQPQVQQQNVQPVLKNPVVQMQAQQNAQAPMQQRTPQVVVSSPTQLIQQNIERKE